MRTFTRVAVGCVLALCAWIAVPGGAGAAPRPPEVSTVIEGRDQDGAPVVIVIGKKIKALKRLTVVADDGIGARYEGAGTLVSKSGTMAVWKLPDNIENDRGVDQYDLVFAYGRRETALPVNVRLGFGSPPPKSVASASLQTGSVDSLSLAPGLRADLDDAATLGGFDASHYTDASNIGSGTLAPSRFSAWDDLLNFENRVGPGSDQLAPGDHLHDAVYPTRAELSDPAGAVNDAGNPVDWSQLKNIPSDVEARDFFTQAELSGAGNINDATNPVNWEKLRNVPAGFADGTDADTTYAAGAGLTLVTGQFAADFAGSGTATTVSRSDHEHDVSYFTKGELSAIGGTLNSTTNPLDWSRLKSVPPDFADGVDADTTYVAGSGLSLNSGTFSVDFAAVAANHNHDGTYSDAAHNHAGVYQPAFTLGSGLDLTSGTLAVLFAGSGGNATAARSDHDHAGTYSLTTHDHAGTYADASHDHNADYFTETELSSAGTVNTSSNPVSWTRLKDVPSDFADGTDDNTQVTTGDGILALGSPGTIDISVHFGGSGTATMAARSDHDHSGVFADASHDHDGDYRTHSELSNAFGTINTASNPVSWTQLKDVPAGFADGTDTDTTLSFGGTGSAGTAARSDHDHTGIYADTGHNHDGTYATSAHNHTGVYQPVFTVGSGLDLTSGTLAVLFAGSGGNVTAARSDHQHSGTYSVTGHNHTGTYATAGHDHTGTYADTGHNHDTEYARTSGIAASGQIRLTSTSQSAAAVYGENTSTAAASGSYGVRGATSSTSSAGVSGENLGTAGSLAFGIYGITQSTSAAGVYGRGGSSQTVGTGVLGDGATGVQGVARGTGGRGVFGENRALSGSGNYGVHGTTRSAGAGVFGENTAGSGGSAYGIHGVSDSSSAAGVFGEGHSTSATSGTGVKGSGQVGVHGTTSSSSGRGVRGENTATTGSTAYGVHGTTDSSSAAGVFGLAASTVGANYGVFGQSDSTAGFGVYANASVSGGVALQAVYGGSFSTTDDIAIFQAKNSCCAQLHNVARIDSCGTGFFNGGTATSGADFAESVAVNAPKSAFEPGDVIVIDTEGTRRFALSKKAESPTVAGIYSTRPGVLARPGDVANTSAWKDKEIPLAITGIVPCKVSGEGGAIKAGDLLVSASIPGHAKKAPENAKQGTIVAKALGAFDGKTGKIEVLITMR